MFLILKVHSQSLQLLLRKLLLLSKIGQSKWSAIIFYTKSHVTEHPTIYKTNNLDPIKVLVAQSVEHLPGVRKVVGSNPQWTLGYFSEFIVVSHAQQTSTYHSTKARGRV